MAGKFGKKRKNRILVRILSVLAVLAAAFLIFIGVFYVPNDHVDVSGSTRYTADEVREMVLTDFAHHNAVYLSQFVKTVTPDNVPFVNSIEIEYEAHNRIALHVSENSPIGYISQNGNDYYFDSKGYVLEAFPSSETTDTSSDTSSALESVTASSGVSGSSFTSDATASSGTAAGNDTSAGNGTAAGNNTAAGAGAAEAGTDTSAADGAVSGTSGSAAQGNALQADMVRTQDTEFHPALTDVTEVTGLTEDQLSVGMTISVDNTGVFSSLLALTKIISKLDIRPDSIEVTNGSEFTLHYGDIRIMLGTDSLLEEKMARAAAILPKLSGMKGVLHLEDFSDDTVNIIFDKDTGETSSDSTSSDSTSSDGTSADASSDTAADNTSSDTGSDVSADGTASDTGTDTSAGGTASDTGSDTSAGGTASDTGSDASAGTGISDNGDGAASDTGADTSGAENGEGAAGVNGTDGGNASYGGYLY